MAKGRQEDGQQGRTCVNTCVPIHSPMAKGRQEDGQQGRSGKRRAVHDATAAEEPASRRASGSLFFSDVKV